MKQGKLYFIHTYVCKYMKNCIDQKLEQKRVVIHESMYLLLWVEIGLVKGYVQMSIMDRLLERKRRTQRLVSPHVIFGCDVGVVGVFQNKLTQLSFTSVNAFLFNNENMSTILLSLHPPTTHFYLISSVFGITRVIITNT